VIWTEEPDPEALEACFTAANLFGELGVRPILGRTFTQEESDRGERPVVLSFELWQRRFGGSPGAIGQTVHLDGKPSQVIGVLPAREQVVGSVRLAMEILLAAVAAVLLIACANLGNLVLARGAGREREVAVRAALGAGRGRLVAQFFSESVVLAAVAGCLGLA